MPSTARASHKHQNECTRDEMLFIPAFTRHNLRSKAGDADADEVEFEGCSQRRPTAAPKRLFDDAEPEAAGAAVERQTRQVCPCVQVRAAAQSPVANLWTSTTASRSPMHLGGATSPSPAHQQQHGFVTPISSETRPDASRKAYRIRFGSLVCWISSAPNETPRPRTSACLSSAHVPSSAFFRRADFSSVYRTAPLRSRMGRKLMAWRSGTLSRTDESSSISITL